MKSLVSFTGYIGIRSFIAPFDTRLITFISNLYMMILPLNPYPLRGNSYMLPDALYSVENKKLAVFKYFQETLHVQQ